MKPVAPVPPDEAPVSEFVRQMREALALLVDAHTEEEKREIQASMRQIMRFHLGPGSWSPGVKRRGLRAGPRKFRAPYDWKAAAAGREADE